MASRSLVRLFMLAVLLIVCSMHLVAQEVMPEVRVNPDYLKKQQEIQDSLDMLFQKKNHRRLKPCVKLEKKERLDSACVCYKRLLNVFPGEHYLVQKSKKLSLDYRWEQWIIKGDTAFNKRDWEEAMKYYQYALALKPYEVYPSDRIKDLQKILNKR